MRRTRAIGISAAMAVAVAGCARHAGPAPERFVPADVLAAVIVPRLDIAAPQLAALLDTSGAFPGGGTLAEWRTAATAQLGFDPLDRRGLASAGIDPRRGAALALRARPGGGRAALLVLPASDPRDLDAVLARLARERLGASERAVVRRGAIEVAVFRPPGGAPALASAVVEGTAIVASGPGAPDDVAAAAALPPAAALVSLAPWTTARRALGDGASAIAFVPPTSPFLSGLWPVRDGVAIGIAGASDSLRVAVAVLLGDREASFRALVGPAGARADPAALDSRAALVGTWRGDPAALGHKLLPLVGARDRAWLSRVGLDLQRDVFDVAGPGSFLAASLAPDLDVAGLSEARVRADLLRLVRFEAVVPLRDAERARAASDRVSAAIARRPLRRGATTGGPWRVATPSGEIAWRIDGTTLLAAGGAPGTLDALAARVAAGAAYRAPTSAASAALQGALGGAVLDVPRLVDAVRALPEQSYGSGPNAFVMRSVVERFVEPAARLAAVSLRADLAEGALVLVLEVEARGAEARRP